ncbi:MAG: O-antigen ligase family protein [Acidobacteria bacterium]|nr:O-antigen ligase family protein [Acidobacteriota bacterium]
MNNDSKQLILLGIATIIVIFLMWTKRHRLLLSFVCFSFFVQIFDTALLTNLPVGRIVGVLYLPQAALQLRNWIKLIPVKAWVINYGWLLILGLFFGFIWPWPDSTYNRPFTLTAPGKTIVYSIRLLTDFSLAIYFAEQIFQIRSIMWIGRAMVAGATTSALAGLFQIFTKIDLYYLITGLGEQLLNLGRARGLVGEPRALGLSCTYGIMILLIGRNKISTIWLILLFINLTGLLITYSASSMVLFAVGIVVGWLFFSRHERLFAIGAALAATLIVFLASILASDQFKFAIETLSLRFDPDLKLAGIPPGTFGQEIAYRLDVFDASALLFLLDQPLYALIGTGPGLVSLPASEYVPPGLYSLIWTPELGINSPPFHGPLLEISNSGVLGLGLWITQVISCWVALRFLYHYSEKSSGNLDWRMDDWKFGYALFLIGSAFYLVQVSYTPLWCVFLSIGWVAVKIRDEILLGRAIDAHQRARPNRIDIFSKHQS